MEYEAVVGLEIHVQLKTKSKMFCGCDNEGEEKPPNTCVCPICMGHPGTLPVINKQAVEWTIMAGLALEGEIPEISKFDRKNYFYPDLPKGYQISQFDKPIVKGGSFIIEINGEYKKIRLTRIHLEEDAAKLLHPEEKDYSLVDFNRAGTPLMEIVTEADLRSPKEAKIFLQELRLLIKYLEISDADMEKGQLRCDANISLRPKGDKKFYPKTEIKNLNSFRSVERALEYEIKRQKELWEEGKPLKSQSTRGWDEEKGETVEQRTKEEAYDYRYFPEPDLPPLRISKSQIKKIKEILPELPQARRLRFMDQYGFSRQETKILTDDKELAHYTEKVISELKAWLLALEEVEGTEQEIWKKYKKKLVRLVANWLINRLLALVSETHTEIKDLKITPENFAEFITLIYQNKISSSLGQKVLEKMFRQGSDPSHIIQEEGLEEISDEKEMEQIIKKVIENNPEPIEDYKRGKENALKFLIGQVMKETRGRANPQTVNKILKERLS